MKKHLPPESTRLVFYINCTRLRTRSWRFQIWCKIALILISFTHLWTASANSQPPPVNLTIEGHSLIVEGGAIPEARGVVIIEDSYSMAARREVSRVIPEDDRLSSFQMEVDSSQPVYIYQGVELLGSIRLADLLREKILVHFVKKQRNVKHRQEERISVDNSPGLDAMVFTVIHQENRLAWPEADDGLITESSGDGFDDDQGDTPRRSPGAHSIPLFNLLDQTWQSRPAFMYEGTLVLPELKKSFPVTEPWISGPGAEHTFYKERYRELYWSPDQYPSKPITVEVYLFQNSSQEPCFEKDDLGQLMQCLQNVKEKWRQLGENLGLSSDELDRISKQLLQGESQGMEKMLLQWLSRKPAVANLASALAKLQLDSVHEAILQTFKIEVASSASASDSTTAPPKKKPRLSQAPEFHWQGEYVRESSNTLEEDDWHDTAQALISIASKWYQLGVLMGIGGPALDTIKASYSNMPHDCLNSMLAEWLRGNGLHMPSWSGLVNALLLMNETTLAHTISKKYSLIISSGQLSISLKNATPSLRDLAIVTSDIADKFELFGIQMQEKFSDISLVQGSYHEKMIAVCQSILKNNRNGKGVEFWQRVQDAMNRVGHEVLASQLQL